jgi:cytochrome P450
MSGSVGWGSRDHELGERVDRGVLGEIAEIDFDAGLVLDFQAHLHRRKAVKIEFGEVHVAIWLNEIDYPAAPPATGVLFVERIVPEPFEYQGATFRQGERIRILLQSFQYSGNQADRMRMFGAAIHACLGRQLSLEVWKKNQ